MLAVMTTALRPTIVDHRLRATIAGAGHDVLLGFDVPPGATRIEVAVETTPRAEVELGLFDTRGPGYRSPGFRGIYGPERPACHVGTADASPGFRAGPLPVGRWTVLLGVGAAPRTAEASVRVRITSDPRETARDDGTIVTPAAVRHRPDWYRGDLHAHTDASSDAWAAGTALTVEDWAATCRFLGLHFAAITDHNVVGQNTHLARVGGDDVLLLPGEEVTSWTHGHATASGLPVDAWLDWRHRPAWLPLGRHERRVTALVTAAHDLGAYLAAAHPFRDPYGWQFFADAEDDPAAMPHGIEVWNGMFGPSDRAAVAFWDALLQRGWRIPANGGSDLHGHETDGRTPGTPTTIVHADALSRDGLVEALRAGRSFITRHPAGVEVYLDAANHDGRMAGIGGTLHARPDEDVTVRAHVRRAVGTVLHVLGGGRLWHCQAITEDAATVTTRVPATAGFVRAEVVRPAGAVASAMTPPDTPRLVPRQPATGGPGARVVGPAMMEALTNPVYLTTGPPPDAPPFWVPWPSDAEA